MNYIVKNTLSMRDFKKLIRSGKCKFLIEFKYNSDDVDYIDISKKALLEFLKDKKKLIGAEISWHKDFLDIIYIDSIY